jgi:hypothetical protein
MRQRRVDDDAGNHPTFLPARTDGAPSTPTGLRTP